MRVRTLALNAGLFILVSVALLLPAPVMGGDLEPPGPPAPTMRTLESLGFDCPNDPAGTTNLLFTFVTNQAGFDTGLSVSNTGADPFGTVGQSGTCTWHFYGANAPGAPFVTPSIAAGTTYASIASTVAPNFQGYVIATCNFAYAHGFAFVSDLGARTLAAGYIAKTVCTDRKWNLGDGQ